MATTTKLRALQCLHSWIACDEPCSTGVTFGLRLKDICTSDWYGFLVEHTRCEIVILILAVFRNISTLIRDVFEIIRGQESSLLEVGYRYS
jgi:hypothetical protein